MNKLTAIILFVAACLTGCAGASNFSAQKAGAPKSAQYMLELDWDYPLTPGKQNYLGANPLELGAVTSVNGYTYVASSLGSLQRARVFVIACMRNIAQNKTVVNRRYF